MSQPVLPTPSSVNPNTHYILLRRTQLSLAAGIALLIGTLVASYMQSSSGLDALKQIELTNQRSGHVDHLRRLLLDAESASRGYLLTHDSSYLTPYLEVIPKVKDTIDTIKNEASRETAQYEATLKLTNYAQGIMVNLESTIVQGEASQSLRTSQIEYGKSLMDAYRNQHSKLKNILTTDNQRLVGQSYNNFQNVRVTTVALAITSLMLLLLAIAQSQKQQDLRDQITGLLRSENQRLEQEVRYRTTELTNLATYLTKVRETEKLNLARELHDELGALLTAAKLDADWIERELPTDTKASIMQRLARMRQTLISVITLKRRITNDLRPALLYDLGLIEALRALADEFRRGGEAELHIDLPQDEPKLADSVSLSLFRIAQEALTNIRKYAQAQHVSLALRFTASAIELTIMDDGIGFDIDSPKLARHGLAGIKHRVYTHHGQLDINTAPGTGTTIRVFIPN